MALDTSRSVQRVVFGFAPGVARRMHVCYLTGRGSITCREIVDASGGPPDFGRRFEYGPPRTLAPDGVWAGIAAGAFGQHACAWTTTGEVWCWGANDAAQVTATPSEAVLQPARRSGVEGARAVVVGRSHSCALLASGSVTCWGDRSVAGEVIDRPIPGVADVAQLVSGVAHVCALHRARNVSCWGVNGSGQLDDGTFEDRNVPTATREAPELTPRREAAGACASR